MIELKFTFKNEDELREFLARTEVEYTVVSDCKCGSMSHTAEPVPVDDSEPKTEPEEEIKVGGTSSSDDEEKPVREPGKPSPGKKRRTKAEIEEDEKYFASLKEDDKGEVVEENDDPVVGDGPTTIKDVRAVLNKLCAKTDISTGRDLLQGFGASRASELKQEDYDDFISECQEKIDAA